MYELTDLYTLTVDPAEYVAWLLALLARLATHNHGYDRLFPPRFVAMAPASAPPPPPPKPTPPTHPPTEPKPPKPVKEVPPPKPPKTAKAPQPLPPQSPPPPPPTPPLPPKVVREKKQAPEEPPKPPPPPQTSPEPRPKRERRPPLAPVELPPPSPTPAPQERMLAPAKPPPSPPPSKPKPLPLPPRDKFAKQQEGTPPKPPAKPATIASEPGLSGKSSWHSPTRMTMPRGRRQWAAEGAKPTKAMGLFRTGGPPPRTYSLADLMHTPPTSRSRPSTAPATSPSRPTRARASIRRAALSTFKRDDAAAPIHAPSPIAPAAVRSHTIAIQTDQSTVPSPKPCSPKPLGTPLSPLTPRIAVSLPMPIMDAPHAHASLRPRFDSSESLLLGGERRGHVVRRGQVAPTSSESLPLAVRREQAGVHPHLTASASTSALWDSFPFDARPAFGTGSLTRWMWRERQS